MHQKKFTIKELPFVNRPREKIKISGIKSLSEEELIAIIFSSGIKGKNIIELSKEIYSLLEQDTPLDINNIMQIKGLGEVKAMQVICIQELVSRLNFKKDSRLAINSPSAVFQLLHSYTTRMKEFLILLNLNHRNEFISKKIITVGLVDCSLFHPREIFIEAIKAHASKIIVVHNHPSGLLSPSENDLSMTRQIKKAGEILGISLVDSIIISRNGYESILERT